MNRTERDQLRRVEGRMRRTVCSFDIGGDSGGSQPSPDPLIGQAAYMNAQTAQQMAHIGEQMSQDQIAREQQYDPILLQQLGLQTQIAQTNADRSGQQWQDYINTYRPIEQQAAQDAQNWDSQSNLDKAGQDAAAVAARDNAAATASATRNATAMGANPNSGRFAGMNAGLALAGAANMTNAQNTAMDRRRAQAIGLRQNAINVGRGLPATALSADQVGLGASGTAVGTATTAINAPANAQNMALPWYSGSMQGNSSAGNLMLGQYQGQLSGWGQQMNYNAQQASGLGSFLGAGLGAIGNAGGISQFFASSEELKTDKEPVDGEEVLVGLRAIPVESWNYKRGAGDGGSHVGPYAEDVRAQFGDKAAPGGKVLDAISMHGLALAAVKALDKKVEKLASKKSRVLGLEEQMGDRDTEPTQPARKKTDAEWRQIMRDRGQSGGLEMIGTGR
jgi:hypothetical protein